MQAQNSVKWNVTFRSLSDNKKDYSADKMRSEKYDKLALKYFPAKCGLIRDIKCKMNFNHCSLLINYTDDPRKNRHTRLRD